MKLRVQFCGGLLVSALAATAFGQGAFQNLDFESPILPLVHVNRGFDFVMASNSIPGWTIFLGASQQDALLYNNYFVGTAVVGLLGPEWTSFPQRIAGNYSVTLQGGSNPANVSELVSAAIAQSSLVPASALSVQIRVREFINIGQGQFTVSLGEQNIPMLALSTAPDHTLFGGDISNFAGLTRELRIAAIATPAYFSSFVIDSIVFSNQPVPEPNVLGLFACGCAVLGWRLFRKPRS